MHDRPPFFCKENLMSEDIHEIQARHSEENGNSIHRRVRYSFRPAPLKRLALP